MAFFDDLWKDITDTFGEAQCGLGFHDGDWVYTDTDKCNQKKVCKRNRCSNISYRTSHEGWHNWEYFKSQSCLQERFCKRCNTREEKERHQSWTDWKYIVKNDCDQIRNCERCQEKDYQTKHTYGSERHLTYINDCTVHEVCNRCGDKKTLPQKEHKWTTIKHPTNPKQYRNYCSRCKEIEDVENS